MAAHQFRVSRLENHGDFENELDLATLIAK